MIAVNLASLLLATPDGQVEARQLLQRAIDLLGPLHDAGRRVPENEDLLRKARRLLGR
jgi:hypothetical protein